MKHIKIPKAIAEVWLKDLRSNPKQGFGHLQDENGGYCCLGRLQIVVSGDVERHEDGSSYGTPSLEWLEKNNIEFFNECDELTRKPWCSRTGTYFTEVNDEGTSFPLIADLLETEIEYND